MPKILIDLTETQAKHLQSLLWFISGPRGAGKTYLMAVAISMNAIDHIGMFVPIIDHIADPRGRRQCGLMVCDILDKANYIFEYNINNNVIKVIGEKIKNELPLQK